MAEFLEVGALNGAVELNARLVQRASTMIESLNLAAEVAPDLIQRANLRGAVTVETELVGKAAGQYRAGDQYVTWSGSVVTARSAVLATSASVLARGPLYSADYIKGVTSPAERAFKLQQMLDDGAGNREVHWTGGNLLIAPYLLQNGGTRIGLRYHSGQIIQCDPTVWLKWATVNQPGMLLGPDGPGVSDVFLYDLGLDQSATDHDGNSMALSVNSTSFLRLYRPRGRNIGTMAFWCDSPESAPTTDLLIDDPTILNSVGGGTSLFGAMADVEHKGGRYRNGADDAVAIQATPRGYPSRIRTVDGTFIDWNKRHASGTANPVLSTPHAVLYLGVDDGTMKGHVGVGSVASMYAVVPLAASDTSTTILRRSRNIKLFDLEATNAGISDVDTTGVPGNGIEVREVDIFQMSGCTATGSRQNGALIIYSTRGEIGPNTMFGNKLSGLASVSSEIEVTGGAYDDNGVTSGINPYGLLVDGGEAKFNHVKARDYRLQGARTQTHGLAATNGAVVTTHHLDARGNISAPTQATNGAVISQDRTRTRDGVIYNSGQSAVPGNDGGVYVTHGLAAPPTRMVLQIRNATAPVALSWEVDTTNSSRVLIRDAVGSDNPATFDWEAFC